jgi:hypothetical protein
MDTLVLCCFVCFCFFLFVLKQIYLFWLFHNGSKIPKQNETNWNKILLVSRNKPKINRNWFSLGSNRIFFICFENCLVRLTLQYIWLTVAIQERSRTWRAGRAGSRRTRWCLPPALPLSEPTLLLSTPLQKNKHMHLD